MAVNCLFVITHLNSHSTESFRMCIIRAPVCTCVLHVVLCRSGCVLVCPSVWAPAASLLLVFALCADCARDFYPPNIPVNTQTE